MPEYSEHQKQQALRLIEEFGINKTAEKTGINRKTLSTWRSREKVRKEVLDENRIPMRPEEIARELREVQAQNKKLSNEVAILKDALNFFCLIPGPVTKTDHFYYIKEHVDKYTLQELCNALDVTPQGYYKYLKRLK